MNTEIFLRSDLIEKFPITWDRSIKDHYEFQRFIQTFFTQDKITVYTNIFL